MLRGGESIAMSVSWVEPWMMTAMAQQALIDRYRLHGVLSCYDRMVVADQKQGSDPSFDLY